MSVRALCASLALCGAVSLCGVQAEAQIIFGYAGGATFKGEVVGYGYGYGYGGWGGCGGYGCGNWGSCGHGCGAGHKGAWIHGGKWSACGACGHGCGKWGCGACKSNRFGRGHGSGGDCSFGCDHCTPTEGGYDAAPSKDLGPTPAAPVPEKEDDSTASGPTLFRPISHNQSDKATFAQGWLAYRHGNFGLARATLSDVVASEPRNVVAHYGLALAQLELGDQSSANATLARAAALEAEQPAAGFGKLMERVQGQRRVWLETARQQAPR